MRPTVPGHISAMRCSSGGRNTEIIRATGKDTPTTGRVIPAMDRDIPGTGRRDLVFGRSGAGDAPADPGILSRTRIDLADARCARSLMTATERTNRTRRGEGCLEDGVR